MLFNSIEFAIFLPIVFLLYWFVDSRRIKYQNILLLIASYIFYGWWDWRFLLLIVFSSLTDYLIGLALSRTENSLKRKQLLFTSVFVNIGFLGFFKYYNFFADSFSEAFTLFGSSLDTQRLSIILPVGISFYTFQTLSYTIDVYRKKLEPTKDVIAFFCFVSFFPQLVAGPIERATNLIPQFLKKRVFNYEKGVDGLRQILWGLFKKVVVADNCAFYVNQIFEDSAIHSGSTLFLGAILFAFQIYGDFSGYSDIAIGTARLFGFNFKQNFAFPYFSRDIAEFWRRWHISLSTWFRDYLYIPLGGSKVKKSIQVRNVFIVFLVSGFWHGANYTFIVWGALNAIYFLPLMLLDKNRKHMHVVAQGSFLPSVKEFVSILMTFVFTVLAWVFFRADSISQAVSYISEIMSFSFFKLPSFLNEERMILSIGFIFMLLGIEWIGREKKYALEKIGSNWPTVIRFGFYYILVLIIFFFGSKGQEFIYFQF